MHPNEYAEEILRRRVSNSYDIGLVLNGEVLISISNGQPMKIENFLLTLAEKLGIFIYEEDDVFKLISIKDYVVSCFSSMKEVFFFISSNSISLWLFGPNLGWCNENFNEIINMLMETFNCDNFSNFFQEFQFQIGALIISPAKILLKFSNDMGEGIQFLISFNQEPLFQAIRRLEGIAISSKIIAQKVITMEELKGTEFLYQELTT
jgi:hypothetical protein